jgi:predicted small secreted protein
MSLNKTGVLVLALTAVVALSSCGNTIRGAGRDAANAVDATQDAGRSVDSAARR